MNIDRGRSKRIYEKLMRIAPDLANIGEFTKSRVSGYMDLCCDVLETGRDFRRIALSHYWKHPSGDMIPDPDMEISVFLDWELAEAMTYQDSFTYESAYPVNGEPPDFEIHTRLNIFLEQWLDNLAEQGHTLAPRK
jgi:uncharacterized protein YqiB (DUF1249 family)